jgi:RimJ/RimL family protein N-acetyltransferase
MTTFCLNTDRITFRLWDLDDLPLAIALWGDPQVTRLIADLGNPCVEQARDRLAREIANWETHQVQYWPIFLRTGEHLGCCGLRPYQPSVFEVGVHILPMHWGSGFATEALRGIEDYAFGTLGATGLFARHHPQNEDSGRVLTKLGYRYTHDEFMQQTGLLHPCYLGPRGTE